MYRLLEKHSVISYLIIIKLVITEGYGVWATTIEGQNAFAPELCFAYVLRDRWSERA